jgi:formylmethanofuran dehydrogenase subunit E
MCFGVSKTAETEGRYEPLQPTTGSMKGRENLIRQDNIKIVLRWLRAGFGDHCRIYIHNKPLLDQRSKYQLLTAEPLVAAK